VIYEIKDWDVLFIDDVNIWMMKIKMGLLWKWRDEGFGLIECLETIDLYRIVLIIFGFV